MVTCAVTCLPEISARVGGPRTLALPYPLGYPLGRPGEPALQRRILERALRLCEGEPLEAPLPFDPEAA